jgi:cytochrome P450
MSRNTTGELRFDPYDVDLVANPYPLYRRLRDEMPLCYNEQHDFFALSRYTDVEKALFDNKTFSSARGDILEFIKADMEIPSGLIVAEDPPRHDIHRRLLSRMFTPRKISALEPRIREFCVRSLDPLVGAGGFDFVTDFGAELPMRVIGMLLGFPDEDQLRSRDHANEILTTEAGRPMESASTGFDDGQLWADYIDWRADNPSDDIVTELLNVQFEDEQGVTRHLERAELLMYVNMVALAGNETTARLIGWAAKVLAEHPDQRRELVADPGLIPQAVEELLRFEGPAPFVSRYVTREVEYYGQQVPAGSVMTLLIASANRDDRQFGHDADVFNIHRQTRSHIAFAVGAHFCIGAALARMEGRIALEEILKRFPEWDVDLSAARMSTTSTVRGWETMPALVRDKS